MTRFAMGLRSVALFFIVGGLSVAAIMMYAAWDHNPNGEFWDYNTGEIHWLPWLLIGGGWFTVFGGGPGLLLLLVSWFMRRPSARSD